VIGYLIRRLVWAVALCLSLSLVTFIIFYVIPTNRVQVRGGGFTDIGRSTQVTGPIAEQYAQFVWHLMTGSLGDSFFSRRSVNDILLDAAPVTISLTIGGAAVWMLIAIPLGVFSALRPRSIVDRGATTLVLIGFSAHPLWLGLIFSYLFGFRLHALPESGYCDLINPVNECGGPVQWFTHMILPWLTFALFFAALYVRMIRANTLETMNEDYVRTARAKGAPEWLVLRSHILRNSMLPVVTMLGMDIGLALGGAVFTETVYSLPGLGKTAISGLNNYDTPTVMGVIVFATLAIIVFNLVVDMLYAWIDPRIRLA
jgi:peptide/nickel transport system permease protein